MGKTAAANRKKKLAKQRKKKAQRRNLESCTIAELLARTQEHIDCFEYEAAQGLCQEALKRDPDNIAVLETSASLCLELQNLDGAKHCLGRAITLQPEEGHTKYLSMAQLMEGRDALQCYLKGVELLRRKITSLNASSKTDKETSSSSSTTDAPLSPDTNDENDPLGATSTKASAAPFTPAGEDIAALTRQVSSALCSIAELFMTDLCDEDEAEEQCQANITRAMEADPLNPEALQLMASFLLVKQEVEEAKKYIGRSVGLWLPGYLAACEGREGAGAVDPVEACPLSIPTRLTTARILIEVEQYHQAARVLEGLVQEDDEIVDCWYLLGWNCYLQGEEHREAARHYFHRATQVHASCPSEDLKMVEHLRELVEEVGPVEETEQDAANIEEELEQESEEEQDKEETMDTN